MSEEYVLTDLDVWIICHAAAIPAILFSSTSLKNSLKDARWQCLYTAKTAGEKFYFIRSSALKYSVVNPAYAFSELKTSIVVSGGTKDDRFETLDNYLLHV
jgi:hypothetical protein